MVKRPRKDTDRVLRLNKVMSKLNLSRAAYNVIHRVPDRMCHLRSMPVRQLLRLSDPLLSKGTRRFYDRSNRRAEVGSTSNLGSETMLTSYNSGRVLRPGPRIASQ